MAIAEVFPYSDQHNLNLDWIITKIKEFSGNQISAIACEQIDADTIKFVITYTDGSTKELTEITLPTGPTGATPELTAGTVTTLPAGSEATVSITGTAENPILNLGIPQGEQGESGEDGAAATIEIGTVTTLAPGANATVTNSGTSDAAVFNFGIPQGATGDPGEIIEQIVPVESTTTASRAYAKGDYFVNNLGVLVQATAAIALGATIDSSNSAAVNATLADEMHGTFTDPAGLTPSTGITIANSGKLKLGRLVIYELMLTGTPKAFYTQKNQVITGFDTPAEAFLGSAVMNFWDNNNHINDATFVLNSSKLTMFAPSAYTDDSNQVSVRGNIVYIV